MSEKEMLNQADNETLGLKTIIVGYIRQWKIFLIAGFISFIPAILYLVLIPNTYEIFARIQIQEDTSSGGSFGLGEAAGLMKSFGLGGSGASSVSIDDEMTILSSNNLLRRVIEGMNIQVEYMKPGAFRYKMYKNSPLLLTFDEAVNARIMDRITFYASVEKSGKVKVKIKSREDGRRYDLEFASLPATIELPQGTFLLSANEQATPGITAPFKMKIHVNPLNRVAENLSGELLVEDVSASSKILELTLQDYEKSRGVDFLNTLLNEYNKQYESVQKKNAEKTLSFIEGRLRNVKDELSVAEDHIQQFKAANGLTELEFDLEFYVGQMQELQKSIIEIEAEKQVITMMYDYVKDPVNKYNVVPMLLSASEGEKGGPITSYNLTILERAAFIKTSKPESPLIAQKDRQLEQLREGVFQTISNADKALAKTLADLKGKENLLYTKMGQVPAMEREYIEYRRQQEIYQGVYLVLLQKREETAIRLGEMNDHARLVDTPFVKQKRVAPRKLYAALFMIIFTLIVPVAFIESKKILKELAEEFKK
ncbi:MAG: tyrosine protein kinase [Tannerellaceae bacterium]|jgi:uncharacterized protein involved in exopolysaccharide biosynthesis|nr:tyrosine protein kinase [Tannerellaceae bacterium]